jgi:photosystem II stability/assembly factor-like uncharacterized protein
VAVCSDEWREVNGSVRRLLLLLALACAQVALAEGSAGWVTQPTEPYPKKRDDIIFVNRQTGFYGTGKGQLYRTDDGGRSWQPAWQHEGTFIRSLGFIDQQTGLLGNLGAGLGGVTDTNPLYRSTDGGRSWVPVPLGSQAIAGVCSIDILHTRAIFEGELRDRIVIHAAGRANGPAQILRSEDAGATWTKIDLSEKAGMILDVKFRDAYTGYVFAGTSADVAQSHALILRTADGGKTWREVYRSARPNEIIWKASFPTERVGYATIQSDDEHSAQQRIAKTTDGGLHWHELALVMDANAQEFGIGFLDKNRGWVGTAAGGFETRDGGKTWRATTLCAQGKQDTHPCGRRDTDGVRHRHAGAAAAAVRFTLGPAVFANSWRTLVPARAQRRATILRRLMDTCHGVQVSCATLKRRAPLQGMPWRCRLFAMHYKNID